MKIRLGDLTRIKTGKLDANASSSDGDFPFFTCSRETLRISTYSYDCECVLVAGNGDLNVKYYNGKFDAYQRTYIIEGNGDGRLYIPYLYYFLYGYVEELRRLSIGGVIKYIKLGNLTDAMIEVPTIERQKQIVKILEEVKKITDDIRKEFQTLDTLIKARFVEMFDSSRYPKKTLREVTSVITKGTTPTTAGFQFQDVGINFFKIESITEQHTINLDKVAHVSEECHQCFRRSQLKEGDILFSIAGAIGRTAIIEKHDLPGNTNQALAIIRLEDDCDISKRYLISAFESPLVTEQYNKKKRGIAQINLSLQDIGDLVVPIPDRESQRRFEFFASQVDKSKVVVQAALDKAQLLFDSLMQQYFG